MRILFLSRWYPYPPDNGSRIRIFNLIRYLSMENEVDLVSFTEEPPSAEQLAAVQRWCKRVYTVPYKPFQGNSLKSMLGYFSTHPRSTLDTFSPAMARQINQMLAKFGYDVVIASQIDMAAYSERLRGVAKVFEEVEVTNLYEQPQQQLQPHKKFLKSLTWQKYARYTKDLMYAHDCCTVVSEMEKKRLQEVAPDYSRVYLVPNGVDCEHYRGDFGAPQPKRLIYSGALTYQANFDAVRFFLYEVFPIVLASQPQAVLYVTGKTDGVPLERLPKMEQVVFTGYVDDIRPWVAQSEASVVPLQIGGGTRIKILESLALGTPVVTTSKGVEGLDLADERDLLVADAPEEFAKEILRIFQNPTLRSSLAEKGRQAVEARYDWENIALQYKQILAEVSKGA